MMSCDCPVDNQNSEEVTNELRKEVARHSEKYFTPWRVALRKWIAAGGPLDSKVVPAPREENPHGGMPYGTVVLCSFCDNKDYYYLYPACLDCPYNMASDLVFEDLSAFFKNV